MSGLARILLARGIEVSGSDLKASRVLDGLAAAGADVWVGHRGDRVPAGPDAIVRSSAVPMANPEIVRAADRGVPVVTRAQVLAAVMRGHRGIAVAGTHGKTTTTSMVAVTLAAAGLEPTFVIGGDLNESGSGAEHGAGEAFVAEADESDASFLLLEPDIGVITNVDADHLDFYADREEIESAFAAFAARCGSVVACADDAGTRRALSGHDGPVTWYGFEDAPNVDIVLSNPVLDTGRAGAVLTWGDDCVDLALPIPGRHNLLNAGAAVAVAGLNGIAPPAAVAALATFGGVRRRFERKADAAGVSFFDDYAHHPTEVVATLAAARSLDPRRLVAVFQPHRYTRTRALWRELGESLAGADVVVITDVYAAGERAIPGVTGKLVVDAAAEAMYGGRVVYIPRRLDLAPFLAQEVRSGDVVLTLGAGDVTMVPDETVRIMADGGP